jgi:hypothetical protein
VSISLDELVVSVVDRGEWWATRGGSVEVTH